MNLVKKVNSIDYHRNGVMGAGFHIVRFSGTKGYPQNMIAIVFDAPCHVAVFDYDKLKAGELRFRENSWRGDTFETELRTAIKEQEAK